MDNEPEYEGVLLFPAFVVIFDDNDRQFLLFEIQFGDFRPKEQSDLLMILKDQDARWRQPQRILATVFALPIGQSTI